MFYFGVDYYPEQWPEARWTKDAHLMAEAGFNIVRLGEFAWSKFEEREGKYDFAWLDRAMTILSEQGMRVLLGTPTASPPPWLVTQHPEILRVREDGHRVTFGNRREYCPNSPTYRDYVCRIVTRMAEHYAEHPAVVGWQIDNEFGERCYCDVCREGFQNWLGPRYGSLEELNARWGTDFWGHRYGSWQEVPIPLSTGNAPNPGLALDYYRFASDSYVNFQQSQIDILRRRCPRHLLLHDMMGLKFDQINYFDLARSLDVVAWNNYPRTQWSMQAAVDPSLAALAHDAMRGLKHQNFWVTEQQVGSGGWDIVSVPPRPGECRLWAWQSIAHGADAILFFRWRTARFGTEQYWHGLLDHAGNPSRRYEEIKRMGAEMHKIGAEVFGSTVKPAVALLLSFDSRFAFQIQPNNSLLNYSEHFHQFYQALHRRHVAIDIAAPTDDLAGYKLVVAPALHVVSEAVAGNLRQFVERGGVLVLTQRSGVKDEANAVFDLPLPGLLDQLCGVQVEEYDSLPPGVQNTLEFTLPELANSHPPSGSVWCDILKPMGATVIARYTKDYYAGKPAITLHTIGKGKVVYVGTLGNSALYETLSEWLLGLSGVRRLLAAPPGIEVTERWQDGRRLLFVLNHTERQQQVTLDCCYRNLLDGDAPLNGTVAIPPRQVLVLLENKHEA